MSKCDVHPAVDMVAFCPACRGSVSSKRKAASSRANGRLGGRPKLKSTKLKRKRTVGRKKEIRRVKR